MSKTNTKVPVVHPLIKAMEKCGEATVELRGFLGTSKDDTIRLYDVLNTSSYMEIPKDAVLYFEPLESNEPGKYRAFVTANQSVKIVRRLHAFEVVSHLPPLKRVPDFWSCAGECEGVFSGKASEILAIKSRALSETSDARRATLMNRAEELEQSAKQILMLCLNECGTKYGTPPFLLMPDNSSQGYHLEKFSIPLYHQQLVEKYL